jgi:phage N-6-adenine-methyltransferase
MNNDLMFSSKTGVHSTPQKYFDQLNELYHFTIDVCANSDNAKCEKYFTPEIDGLKQNWSGVCWMNPPYGKEITDWIRKAYLESEVRGNCKVIALLPARTDTKWFHQYIYNKDYVTIHFIKGRIKFSGMESAAPFPSMLVVFHKKTKKHFGQYLKVLIK